MVAKSSRMPHFFELPLSDRLKSVADFANLSPEESLELKAALSIETADCMIENVVGAFSLPLAVVPNFRMNGLDYMIPLAVEEPSIVSGLSFAGKVSRWNGGIHATYTGSLMTGQVQIIGVQKSSVAYRLIAEKKQEIIAHANALEADSIIVRNGGGVKDIYVKCFIDVEEMIVVDFEVDVKDAHGANFITRVAEGISPMIERITGGEANVRILSNFAPERVVHAKMRIPLEDLTWHTRKDDDVVVKIAGERVAKRMQYASLFAENDITRAVTHNKGIANGIDPLLLATGNDWRAQEAGGHAYAMREGTYKPWSTWRVVDNYLVGSLDLAMQLGSVGGISATHPAVKIALKILGAPSGQERVSTQTLSELCGAVGLAQNFAALYTLVTKGIVAGHMPKHAYNIALAGGVQREYASHVAKQMIDEGFITVSRARELAQEYKR